jgi:hypothetical protein
MIRAALRNARGLQWRQEMPSDETWLDARAFALIAEVTPQAARCALRRAVAGQPWHGSDLLVRPGPARASWEVALSSLPARLQTKPLAIDYVDVGPADAAASPAAAQARWRTIASIVALPRRTADRQAALADAIGRSGKSRRTLLRWIARYEAHGLRGLTHARPSDAGRPRVFVSRPFDRAFFAAGYDKAVLINIAAAVRANLKGLWASRAEHAGAREIERLAEFLLSEICQAHKVSLPATAMRLSRRMVERFAHFRVVNQRRNDRKAFDDARPRIRRDWTALAPMERVVADVKHLDVLVEREDGTTAWPKIIAFMDAGTARVFVRPVLLDPGEGVRQEHVIEAFLAMVCDPCWGFPQGLYLDNGAEFGALAKIDSALQLLNDPGARTLIYARPYNAAAKPIESLFSRLDRYAFSLLPGYAGPNRMAKKVQTLGRPPKPFPGGWAVFEETLGGLIDAHNQRPVGGQWAGRSPNDWFTGKVEQGWSAAQVDLWALDSAFCERDSRRVDRGIVRIAGERFIHAELQALASRTVVDLALPWRRGALPLCRTRNGSWVYLEREVPFPARWIEGARESSRRQQRQNHYVSQLAREAPALDPVAIKIRAGQARLANPPAPRRVDNLDLGTELRAMAQPRRAHAQLQPALSEADLRRAHDLALTERLERKLNGGS